MVELILEVMDDRVSITAIYSAVSEKPECNEKWLTKYQFGNDSGAIFIVSFAIISPLGRAYANLEFNGTALSSTNSLLLIVPLLSKVIHFFAL